MLAGSEPRPYACQPSTAAVACANSNHAADLNEWQHLTDGFSHQESLTRERFKMACRTIGCSFSYGHLPTLRSVALWDMGLWLLRLDTRADTMTAVAFQATVCEELCSERPAGLRKSGGLRRPGDCVAPAFKLSAHSGLRNHTVGPFGPEEPYCRPIQA